VPQIIMAPQPTGSKRLDGSVRKQAYAFLEKLSDDDTTPGLHVEPINGSADPRVRTGRVSDFYRAVLFKLQGKGTDAHYVYLGIYPHDDAIALAKKATLKLNPVNGIAELITAETPSRSAYSSTLEQPTPPSPDRSTRPLPPPPQKALAPLLGSLASLDDLVNDLGIDPQLAEQALQVVTEDELLDLVETAVQWQASALLDLGTGRSVQEIKESLGIDEAAAPEPDQDPDDTLLDAIRRPAALMQFAFIEDDDELRRVIEDGDFEAWRVFLHPEQRKWVSRSFNGPFRLSGGAGTGKTVVLLHRARWLSRRNAEARILLTTFTTTLAQSMREALQSLDPDLPLADRLGDPGVFVSGIDAAVSAALRQTDLGESADVEAVLGPRSNEIGQRTAAAAWQQVVDSAGEDLPSDLRSPAFFTAEYATVVLPARITTLEDYLRVRRPGRGVALDRRRRVAVWKVIESFRARASVEGSLDFTEAAAVAATRLRRLSTDAGVLCDHVLVDEGQDLNPTHWQFLRAIVAEHPDDIFIAEDAHQRIYGSAVVLGRYGVRIVGRAQRLTLNYRTTAQNLHFAVRVLEGETFVDLEETVEQTAHYRSARSGPAPDLIAASSLGAEFDRAAELVKQWIDAGAVPETIGVLVRDNRQAAQVTRGLEERGVKVRAVAAGPTRGGQPLVLTMHRAKGMEFSRVLLFDVGGGSIPASYLLRGLSAADREDVLRKERSLLYVAATRARDQLVVMWSGEASPMLPLP
jgi:hypothetical protein